MGGLVVGLRVRMARPGEIGTAAYYPVPWYPCPSESRDCPITNLSISRGRQHAELGERIQREHPWRS